MKRFILALGVVGLGACTPLVRDQDLTNELTHRGYSKILLRDPINCGRLGKGRHFMGQQKQGTKVLGQICYVKASQGPVYNVAVNHVLTGESVAEPRGHGIKNPW